MEKGKYSTYNSDRNYKILENKLKKKGTEIIWRKLQGLIEKHKIRGEKIESHAILLDREIYFYRNANSFKDNI